MAKYDPVTGFPTAPWGNDKDPKKVGLDDAMSSLLSGADRATDLAKGFESQGQDLFGPAAQYLKAVISGDRNALMLATQPERNRVIDQYSAAKKAIAEFTPRGGGQAGAMNQLQAKQASDLSSIGGTARREGVGTALEAGTRTKALGLSAEGLAGQEWAAILEALTQKDASNKNMWGQFGQAAGTLLALALI